MKQTRHAFRRYSSAIMTDETPLVVLATFPDEALAEMLAEALEAEGIKAMVEGGTTGSFRAEAPGMVKVLIQGQDADNARAVFEEWEHQGEAIDWDNVDLGEFEDGVPPAGNDE